MIVGFNWGGWSLESTADEASRSAVVAVLAPICVDKFQRSADATDKFVELKKVSSYQQGNFIEKGGWATLPGTDKANFCGRPSVRHHAGKSEITFSGIVVAAFHKKGTP
ncbi:MAG: hypothetical protein ACXWDN_12720 [Limisphaerales bacterium]